MDAVVVCPRTTPFESPRSTAIAATKRRGEAQRVIMVEAISSVVR
jgi:hypothetical protein